MSAPWKSLWSCLELACCNWNPDADDGTLSGLHIFSSELLGPRRFLILNRKPEGRRVHPCLSIENHWPLHVSDMHVATEGGTLGNCTISDTYLQVIRRDLDALGVVSSKVQLLFICGDFFGVLFGLKLSFAWITLQHFWQHSIQTGWDLRGFEQNGCLIFSLRLTCRMELKWVIVRNTSAAITTPRVIQPPIWNKVITFTLIKKVWLCLVSEYFSWI